MILRAQALYAADIHGATLSVHGTGSHRGYPREVKTHRWVVGGGGTKVVGEPSAERGENLRRREPRRHTNNRTPHTPTRGPRPGEQPTTNRARGGAQEGKDQHSRHESNMPSTRATRAHAGSAKACVSTMPAGPLCLTGRATKALRCWRVLLIERRVATARPAPAEEPRVTPLLGQPRSRPSRCDRHGRAGHEWPRRERGLRSGRVAPATMCRSSRTLRS